MSSEDLPLLIPYNAITDYLSCPVCMCQMKNTHMTPCGHRYCQKCIRECIDRHHKCPCCNKVVHQNQLIRDIQYDNLIETIDKEKETSETQYFDALINTAVTTEGTKEKEFFSPVHQVLRRRLRSSLAGHEKYYQDMKKEFQIQMLQLETRHRSATEDLHNQGLSTNEIGKKITDLEKDHEEQKLKLQQDLDRCGELVAEAFDRYLGDHIPTLCILPVKVSFNLLNKSIEIPNVELKPQDSLEDIQKTLAAAMLTKGDKVVKFGDDMKFVCFGPFSQRSSYEMHHLVRDMVEHGAKHPDVQILPSGCRPVLQFAVKPGSCIAIYGSVVCESDLPKKCFAEQFVAGNPQTVDYFSCGDCHFNWICRSCMEVCHKDHKVVPYIMNHQPTWGCCYCLKKKTCQLLDVCSD